MISDGSAYGQASTAPRNQPVGQQNDQQVYLSAYELRRQYENYLTTKTWEIMEKAQARRYNAGDQWTADELKKLKLRNQPKVTRNRIKRKINGVVGLIERLRQDPKCYAREPGKEADAELATAVIRYVLDANRWESLSSKVAADAAREGIGGLELGLKKTPQGDLDITLTKFATDTIFYDPRSFEADFSDVLFCGTAKWCDIEIAKLFCPEDKWDALTSQTATDGGASMAEDSNRSFRWMDATRKRVRLVDQWYFRNGQWCWALYTYGTILLDGISPFVDSEGKTINKFMMFSANVDPDGDRYGFFRDMKDTQDEMNHRYSKALHLLNSRRVIARRGTIDINKTRIEGQKPDGIIEWDVEKPEFEDAQNKADMAGQLQFLEDAKQEIENFGPNPALIGQGGVEGKSGRAIALMQQAGIAELGPYIIEYKDWKLRVYRAVFCACKKHWTAQRWIRVTDANEQAQLIAINALRYDPMTLQPQMVNQVSMLDVDIIIDEGADTINMMQDAFDTLSTLASRGAQVPPGLLIELAPIQASVKKKWLDRMEQQDQPDPDREQAKKIALESEQAKTTKTKSETIKNLADAFSKAAAAMGPVNAPYDPSLLDAGRALDSGGNWQPAAPAGSPPGGAPVNGGGGPPGSSGPPPGPPPPQSLPPGSLAGGIDAISGGLAGPKPPMGPGYIP